jgi:hypothetical protein
MLNALIPYPKVFAARHLLHNGSMEVRRSALLPEMAVYVVPSEWTIAGDRCGHPIM